ncbi:hypothetical protein B0H19DRAFT_1076601 [Mycena capillaripes]|nr:hypothetical protein B0H19DRAFT_1076601 [Mycena capillaripes]
MHPSSLSAQRRTEDSYLWRFPQQQKVCFATLRFGNTLETVSLNYGSGISFGPLLDFIRRHPSVRKLELDCGALRLASLTESPRRTGTFNIACLFAPPLYIPYLRPAVSGVQKVTLKLNARMKYDTYVRALAAIDPAWPVHTLALDFQNYTPLSYTPGLSVHAIPWRAHPDAGMEARLHTVRVLKIHNFKLPAEDIEPLARWLTRFPALVQEQFKDWFTIDISMVEPAVVLARSIAEALNLQSP